MRRRRSRRLLASPSSLTSDSFTVTRISDVIAPLVYFAATQFVDSTLGHPDSLSQEHIILRPFPYQSECSSPTAHTHEVYSLMSYRQMFIEQLAAKARHRSPHVIETGEASRCPEKSQGTNERRSA